MSVRSVFPALLLLQLLMHGCGREPASSTQSRPAPPPSATPPKPERAPDQHEQPVAKAEGDPDTPTAGAEPAAARPAPNFEDAKSAMAELVSSVLARDPARLLACFSRSRPWTLTSIQGHRRSASRYSYTRLEAGLKEGGEFRDVLFGDSPDDNLRQEIEVTGQAAWVAKTATTFTPPGVSRDVFVTWRREGSRYVVSDIAFPF